MLEIEFLNSSRKAGLKLFVNDLRPGDRVLEFGAGTGAQARYLASSKNCVSNMPPETSNFS